MNPRLMIALVAVLLLVVGQAAFRGYRDKLNSLDSDIRKKKADLVRIQQTQKREQRGRWEWARAGRQTLSTDANEAQTLLRDELFRLTGQTGLANADIQIQGVRPFGRKVGLRTLNCKVTGEGTLADIVKFLFELHRQPYEVRCKRLALDRPKGKNVPVERLVMTAELDTLILPTEEGLPTVQPVDLAGGHREPMSRPAELRLEGYAELLKKKMFEPYTPPIPPPTKVVARTPAPDSQNVSQATQLIWNPAANAKTYEVYFSTEGPDKLQLVATLPGGTTWKPPNLDFEKQYWWKVNAINDQGKTEGDVWSFTTGRQPSTPVVEKPPEPPLYANLVLARIISSPLTQQVVLENPQNRTAPDTRVELGDAMYKGRLVLIHSRGAVSDTKEDDALWFHPLTEPLQNARPLTPRDEPEVYEAYQEQLKLSVPAEGISQAGGENRKG